MALKFLLSFMVLFWVAVSLEECPTNNIIYYNIMAWLGVSCFFGVIISVIWSIWEEL